MRVGSAHIEHRHRIAIARVDDDVRARLRYRHGEALSDGDVDAVAVAAVEVGDSVVPAIHTEHEDVRAQTARQVVVPGAAVDAVGVVIADDRIVQAVTAAIARFARQDEVFDIVAEGVGNRGMDDVRPLSGMFEDAIMAIVDVIAIVALAADHTVGASATIDRVVAAEAEKDIVAAVAIKHIAEMVATPGDSIAVQGQVLEIGAQAIVERAIDRVGALTGIVGHPVAGIADIENIIAHNHRTRRGRDIDLTDDVAFSIAIVGAAKAGIGANQVDRLVDGDVAVVITGIEDNPVARFTT